MHTITISKDIINEMPEIQIFGLIALDVNNETLINFNILEKINELHIDAEIAEETIKKWQVFHKEKKSAKRARTSVEYLYNAFIANKIKKIAPLVDIYNFASLATLCPLGGEDMDKIGNTLTLEKATGDEIFISLSSKNKEVINNGEIIWSNGDKGTVCRSLNWIESDTFKITNNTNNIVFITEMPDKTFPCGSKAITLLAEILKSTNAAKGYISFHLSKEATSFSI